jgi:hypothetical protein
MALPGFHELSLRIGARPVDIGAMRSITGLCVTFGTLAGGYVPTLWGGSDFSLTSLVTAALGGVAGLWLALRLQA